MADRGLAAPPARRAARPAPAPPDATPNEKYAALVAAAGYLPLPLASDDYLELLPVQWRQINDYGIRIDNRTYDCAALGPWRRQHSGVIARRGLWEVHYDPYDVSQVFLRTPDGWITVPWTHLPMITAPFADFTWRHARRLTVERGRDAGNESEVARVLDELLTRAEHGPDRTSAKAVARTRAVGSAHGRPAPDQRPTPTPVVDERSDAEVIPFGVFDADAEAERWI